MKGKLQRNQVKYKYIFLNSFFNYVMKINLLHNNFKTILESMRCRGSLHNINCENSIVVNNYY
jgi:hypothetical protein